MMPLAMMKTGEEAIVMKIGGNEDGRRHLADLGFVPGARIKVISSLGSGNIIVILKESRLALTAQMANKIMVSL